MMGSREKEKTNSMKLCNRKEKEDVEVGLGG
jgi:hypothetical protein